ncbi:MAG: hypothetical protein AB1597_03075 [Chloroflexota bacterium]
MTVKIVLIPTLSHCIETAAKAEYEKSLRQLLAEGNDRRELSERVEVLTRFLSTADFRKLRMESERYLLEGQQVKFLVYQEDGVIRYRMEMPGD